MLHPKALISWKRAYRLAVHFTAGCTMTNLRRLLVWIAKDHTSG
jgi:hypothetical protein